MPLYEFNLNPTEGEDKIIDTTQQTAGYFPGGAGSLVNTKIFTASLADSNESYYFNIADDHPDSSSADVVFSVAYGHKGGSGSKLETSTKSESEAVYKQWAQILLAPSEVTGGFGISKAGTSGRHYNASTVGAAKSADNDIYVLVGKRSLYKERMNKKNWTIYFSGSTHVGSSSTLVLTDDSDTTNATATPVGPRYNIVSGANGSIHTAAATKTFGWFYPDLGTFVFSAAELSSSLGGPTHLGSGNITGVTASFSENGKVRHSSSGFAPNLDTSTKYDPANAVKFINCLRSYNGDALKFRSEENVNSVAYMCRLKAGQGNFSTNYTFVSGSYNEIRNEKMKGNPQTFITGIGLIDANQNVVAIAKLSAPVQKNFSSEATFKVKLSY